MEVRLDGRRRDMRHVRPVPAGLVVLVDQAGAHALGEFRVAAAVQRHGVLQAEHLGQRQVAGAADLFPHQVAGQRAAAGDRLGRAGQQAVVVLTQGRFAGKKAVVVKSYEEGNKVTPPPRRNTDSPTCWSQASLATPGR